MQHCAEPDMAVTSRAHLHGVKIHLCEEGLLHDQPHSLEDLRGQRQKNAQCDSASTAALHILMLPQLKKSLLFTYTHSGGGAGQIQFLDGKVPPGRHTSNSEAFPAPTTFRSAPQLDVLKLRSTEDA